ncbi:MAG: transposase [Terriglobia bacterium]
MKRRAAPRFSPHLHFVTARTNQRRKLFREPKLSQEFLEGLRDLRQKHAFRLYAYVLMPDHFHLVVRPSDGDISELMKKIKSLTARKIVACLKGANKARKLSSLRKVTTGRRRHTFQVWQDGFHTVELWSGWMIRKKIDYIHANPLRKGLVRSAKDYPWSSFSAYHGIGRAGIPLDPVRS